MTPGDVLIGIGGAVPFLVTRHFCKDKKLRFVLVIPPAVVLVALLFALVVNYGQFAFPYEHLGTYKTTDVEGNEYEVGVYSKYLNNQIPPGLHPRIKLVASSPRGRAVTTFDTEWRGWVGSVKPVSGGLEVFGTLSNRGQVIRFQLKGNRWSITRAEISEATSLRENKLEGNLK